MPESHTASDRRSARLHSLRPALRFLRPYTGPMLGAGLALVFTATVTLSLGQGVRLLIDQGFAAGAVDGLSRAMLVFFALIALLAAGTFVRFYLVSWIGERVTADIRRAVFDHVVGLHPGFFEENASGEIQSRLTTDTTLLQTVIGSSVSIALRNALMFVGGLIWLFVTNPKLTAIVLVSVPVVIMPILFFGRRVRRLSRYSQDRVADVGTYVGETLQNIKTVQAFNHQDHDRAQFARIVDHAFTVAIQRIRQRSWLTVAVILLVLGAVGAMLWVGGQDVINGRITPGELAAFIFYAVIVAGSVAAISEVYGDLQRAAGATERLMELLHAENAIVPPPSPAALPDRLAGRVTFEQVCFAYPSRPDTPAVDDFSLDIAPGSSLALVGASGAGKSTLFDLLLRFYRPQSGVIRVDGIDTATLDPGVLRRHIGIVPQQPVLFTGNVMDNIRYARPDADDRAVIEAAEAAHAGEFIERLPEGYYSFLGEGGIRLSGGQRQRLAIARAILKDPEILLLDEATSALDAESEFMVQQALERLMAQRTTLVIAHRLATVVDVDTIAVMDRGQLVATGTHQALLSRSPLYARWAQLQFGDTAMAQAL